MRNAVVCLATVIACVAVSGCRPSVPKAAPTALESHGEMIEHIGEGHGIHIGTGTNADVVVTEASNTVTVVFTPGIVKRLSPDCLPVLGFAAPRRELSRAQFDKFLEDFHDYLLLTYGEGKGPKP